jgi:hypothetical protein
LRAAFIADFVLAMILYVTGAGQRLKRKGKSQAFDYFGSVLISFLAGTFPAVR